MSIVRNNSAKIGKSLKFFQNRSERRVVCHKILELKGNVLFERKYILMHDCQPWEKIV
jgi:hypothetical protein